MTEHRCPQGHVLAPDTLEWYRAEIAGLRVALASYKEGARIEAEAGDEARAEVKRLRADLTLMHDRWDESVREASVNMTDERVERLRAAATDYLTSHGCDDESSCQVCAEFWEMLGRPALDRHKGD